jgi:lysyl-tRNA synthetase class 1
LALIKVSPNKTVRGNSGILDVKSMGNALEDGTLRTILPEDVWKYLTVLYVDRRGINLRNDLAHGLVSYSAFNQTLSDRVFHSLLVMSLIRRIDQMESGDH